MNQFLVIFDSWSNNTEAIGNEFADELKCRIEKVDSKIDLDSYQVILVGSPVHFGLPTFKIFLFLLKISKNKEVFFFCTYGAPGIGNFASNFCLKFMQIICKAKCIGTFKSWGFHHLLRTNKGRPNKSDKNDARLSAQKLIKVSL